MRIVQTSEPFFSATVHVLDFQYVPWRDFERMMGLHDKIPPFPTTRTMAGGRSFRNWVDTAAPETMEFVITHLGLENEAEYDAAISQLRVAGQWYQNDPRAARGIPKHKNIYASSEIDSDARAEPDPEPELSDDVILISDEEVVDHDNNGNTRGFHEEWDASAAAAAAVQTLASEESDSPPKWAQAWLERASQFVGAQALYIYTCSPEFEAACKEAVQDEVEATREILRKDLMPEVRAALEFEVWSTLVPEVERKLRAEMEAEVRKDLEHKLRTELEPQMRAALARDLRPEIERQLQSEGDAAMQLLLSAELTNARSITTPTPTTSKRKRLDPADLARCALAAERALK